MPFFKKIYILLSGTDVFYEVFVPSKLIVYYTHEYSSYRVQGIDKVLERRENK